MLCPQLFLFTLFLYSDKVNEQLFDGEVEPTVEAGAAVIAAANKRKKEVPNVQMLGHESQKSKKKKKKKRKSSSSSSDSETESEKTRAAKDKAKEDEKARKEEERKAKEAAAAAARGGKVEEKDLMKEAGAIHKKTIELQMIEKTLQSSKLPDHQKKEMAKTLSDCINKLGLAETAVMNSKTDSDLIATLGQHEEALTNADCEKDWIKARIRKAAAEKQKDKKDKKAKS
jgi:hypothetical protein